METAAAAIANMIAYNLATARAEGALLSSEDTPAAPNAKGIVPSFARNWDLIGVCMIMGTLVTYATSQLRM